MTDDQPITICFSRRYGTFSFSPDGVELALKAITGPVERGPWMHAVDKAHRAGGPITLGELASSIVSANKRLLEAREKKMIFPVKCDCGHTWDSDLVIFTSHGSYCINCYDRMSKSGVKDVEASRLIAAAPDLLMALKSLVEWGRTYTSPRDANSPHQILIDAVAAIAKAEGVSEI